MYKRQSLETPSIRFSPFPEGCSARFIQGNIFKSSAYFAICQCLFCSSLGQSVLRSGANRFPTPKKDGFGSTNQRNIITDTEYTCHIDDDLETKQRQRRGRLQVLATSGDHNSSVSIPSAAMTCKRTLPRIHNGE